MVGRLKSFFLNFICGRLGLAITFWFYGVLIAITLDFLTSKATALWQVILISAIAFFHFILIVIAVWNASKLYLGRWLWKWLARIAVFLNVVKWMWYFPLLFATISNVIGLSIHSNTYWELNTRKLVCEPAEYLRTPEMLAKKYQCKSSVSLDGKVTMTRCWQGSEAGDFIFSKNKQDCLEYLTKIKRFKEEHKNK